MSAKTFSRIRASSGRSAGPRHLCRRPERQQIAFVQVAGEQQRLRYLATAKIWSDPGDVTPEMVTAGRPLKQSRRDSRLRFAVSHCRASSPNQGKTSAATRRNSRARHRAARRSVSSTATDRRMATARSFQRSRRRNSCGLSGSSPIRSIRSRIDCRDCPADPMAGTGHAPDARTSQHSNRS